MSAPPTPAEALFAKLSGMEPAPLRLAASILILRDGAAGIEVLMVVRNKAIETASGAMVYPGGRLMDSDHFEGMGGRLLGTDRLARADAGLRVAAIREAFEEIGMIPAGLCDGAEAHDDHLAPIHHLRGAIDRNEADFGAALCTAGILLDLARLAPFARIVAPNIAPKRFDTHFYAVAAPDRQVPRVDGREITDALWVTAAQALAMDARGERQILFPTRMVLHRLGSFTTVAQALSAAHAEAPQPLAPKLMMQNGEVGLATNAIPGFPATWESLDMLTGGRKNTGARG